MQAVLASASQPDDGVNERLAAIQQRNCTFDQSADLDIVHEGGDEEGQSDECEGVFAAAAMTARCVAGSGMAVSGAACAISISKPAASVSGLEAAKGQQAAAMVLNVEDIAQSTAEVLELELETLDLAQLEMLGYMFASSPAE